MGQDWLWSAEYPGFYFEGEERHTEQESPYVGLWKSAKLCHDFIKKY